MREGARMGVEGLNQITSALSGIEPTPALNFVGGHLNRKPLPSSLG